MKKILLTIFFICVFFIGCSQNNTVSEQNIADRVNDLVTQIASSPSYSSNTIDYINEHKEEYDELVKMNIEALKVLFEEFNVTTAEDVCGLEDVIKLTAVREILGDEDIEVFGSTVYEWYNAYKNHVITLYSQNSRKFLEEHAPKSCVLLDVLGI